jgi:pyridoxal phosphate enzyme (YggS family)
LESTLEQVRANYENVRKCVATAAEKSGRPAESVTIVGVTKYVSSEIAGFLVESGCRDLGESRPQSLWEKAEKLADNSLRWHLIGHLQRNKAKRTIPFLQMIHSVDSERILDQIVADTSSLQHPVQLLLELNVTSDPTKTGLVMDDAKRLLDKWCRSNSDQLPIANVAGLMGMSSLGASEVQVHEEFEAIRVARDKWAQEFDIPLPVLSMGMSDDFEIAIAHGSTHVRLGSILFPK